MAHVATAPTSCAWCAAPLPGGAAGVAVCRSCGAATTSPWPSDEALEHAYGNWYRPESGRFASLGDAVLRWTRSRLARRIEAVAPAGPVLDVGCGDGHLLDALHAIGRHAVGLERRSTRADVLARDLSQVEGEWAAIVFWHSLEHMREPGADLARAAELLRPGGVLFVAIPNFGSLQARAFGRRWFALDLPRHLVHVPAAALLPRLLQLGLGVERVSHLRGGQVVFGWLHGLVGALPGAGDLYEAIRRPEARAGDLSPARRAATLVAATALLPVAGALTAMEVACRRGGSVYVEARRPER
jgi:SAM-dependent methyltransferase